MNNKSNQTAIVGIVTFVMLVIVAILLIWQSDLYKNVSGYRLTGRFDHVGGIIKGAVVRYRGYTVGKVKSITPKPEYIDVEFFVEGHIDIPEGSTVKILFDGLVGENYVQINPNPEKKTLLKAGDIIYGKSGSDLANFIDLGSQNLLLTEDILVALKSMVTDKELITNIKQTAKNINILTSDMSTILHTDNIQTLITKTNLTINNLNNIITKLGNNQNIELVTDSLSNIHSASEELSNPETIAKIKSIINNLNQASEGANNFLGDATSSGLFQTIAQINIDSNTQVLYNESVQKGYFDTLFLFNKGRYGLIGGMGNMLGTIKFQHLQQSYKLTPKWEARAGIFYNKEGISLHYKPFKKLNLYSEIYDFEHTYYKVASQINLKEHIGVELIYRKDSIVTSGGVDLGVNLKL